MSQEFNKSQPQPGADPPVASKKRVVSEQIGVESLPLTTYWKDVRRRFLKNKIAVLGLLIFIVIIALCVFAPCFTQFDPEMDMDLSHILVRPFTADLHPLGTDDLGRDIWTRLLYGGRMSAMIGVSVTLLSAALGIIIGLVSGYYGGWIDSLLMRCTDIMLSFPFLIIAIAIMAALGSSQQNVILALAIVGWPRFARLTRGQVLAVKNTEYVESARVAGFKDARIIFNHVFPNCIGPLIIQATLSTGGAILSASGLSFLGLGCDAAAPDWGVMLNQGRNYLQQAAYLTTIPGIAISLTVLSMNWIGDGLRDAFDPKMRK